MTHLTWEQLNDYADGLDGRRVRAPGRVEALGFVRGVP